MKNYRNTVTGTIASALALLSFTASAQTTAAGGSLTRIDLQRHDLSIPGHEAIQVRVDFPPGVAAPDHKHPGEEIIYVLEGTIEYQLEGKPPVTLRAGGVLFVPAGVPHSAKNVGKVKASELATYVVEKGKPLVTLVK